MTYNPLTRITTGGSGSFSTTGTHLSLSSNVTGVTSHTDAANATLYVLGDCALNGVCHAKTIKSSLPSYHQSDERVKKNFATITNPFYAMDRIPGYTFDYKDGNVSSMGFKAQDMEKIYPFLVSDVDGIKYTSYTPLLAVNWEATKVLRDQQCTMDRRIQKLEEDNDYMHRILGDTLPRLHAQIQNLNRILSGQTRSHTLRPSSYTPRNHRSGVDHDHGKRYQRPASSNKSTGGPGIQIRLDKVRQRTLACQGQRPIGTLLRKHNARAHGTCGSPLRTHSIRLN